MCITLYMFLWDSNNWEDLRKYMLKTYLCHNLEEKAIALSICLSVTKILS